MQAGAGELGLSMIMWTGKFRAVHSVTASGTDVSQYIASSGTVRLTANSNLETRVELSLSGPADMTGTYAWAIVPGACRSGGIPLLPVSSFPALRMSQGRGQLDEAIQIQLPTSGSYHVNVYSGASTDESDVVSCAPLKLEQRPDNR